MVNEEDTQDTDYDTEDLADLPTDSDSDEAPDDQVGLDPGSDGDPPMTIKAKGGGADQWQGGQSTQYKVKQRYRSSHTS